MVDWRNFGYCKRVIKERWGPNRIVTAVVIFIRIFNNLNLEHSYELAICCAILAEPSFFKNHRLVLLTVKATRFLALGRLL